MPGPFKVAMAAKSARSGGLSVKTLETDLDDRAGSTL
jgi:hypothetical protein